MKPRVPCASALRRMQLASLALPALAAALLAQPAAADDIVVGEDRAAGRVVKVGPKGFEVETVYGKGNVLVPYDKVTTLETEQAFVIVHGDDGITRGRLVGVREGSLLVEDEAGTLTSIPLDTLFDSYPAHSFDASALEQWRTRLRYWDARYDLAFAATDATVNTLALVTGFEVERSKTPTRLLAIGTYRYGVKDDPKGDNSRSSTTDNELFGSLRGEYTFLVRYYGFLAGAAEYDAVESLSYRLTPKGGLGIHIFQSEKARWDVDAGVAWVHERFFGGEDNSFAAAAFGTDARFELPWGIIWTARGEYLPAFDDWTGDYLLRGSTALEFPMTDWLSLRTGVVNQYDNTPAEDSSRNSLTATTGLALRF